MRGPVVVGRVMRAPDRAGILYSLFGGVCFRFSGARVAPGTTAVVSRVTRVVLASADGGCLVAKYASTGKSSRCGVSLSRGHTSTMIGTLVGGKIPGGVLGTGKINTGVSCTSRGTPGRVQRKSHGVVIRVVAGVSC